MALRLNGLLKLLEEIGELTQIVAKKLQFPHTDIHPDGKGSMRRRIEDEIADTAAASQYVIENMKLDENYIRQRAERKLRSFYEEYTQGDDPVTVKVPPNEAPAATGEQLTTVGFW